MTLITWQDGGPLFKDGKIGTEQGCCCGCLCPFYVSVRDPFGAFGGIDPDLFPDIDECADVQAHYNWMVSLLQHYGYEILSQEFYTLADGCGFYIDAKCCACWLEPYWGNPGAGGNFQQSLLDYPDRWVSAYAYNGGPPVVNWIGYGNDQWLPVSFLFYKTPMDIPSDYYVAPVIEDATLPDFAEGFGEALPICANPLP